MSQLKDYLKIALMNILHNKARSILTMLGIIIGIASVIMIVSMGDGVRGLISGELNGLFGGQIVVYRNDGESFTADDIQAILEKVPHVKAATEQFSMYGTTYSERKGEMVSYFYFGNPGYDETKTNKVKKGRYFTWDEYNEGACVIVLSEQSAMNLFGSTDCIGQYIECELYGSITEFKVIGVRSKSDSGLYNMVYSEDSVEGEVPTNAIGTVIGWDLSEDLTDAIYVVSDAKENEVDVANNTVKLLESRYDLRNEKVIQMESFSSELDEFNKIINIITYFISFVAAIALCVGGIGVMNIMLVSVTERTREIGIRKALGARTGSIMVQFLAEAAVITMLGGIIGIIIGFAGAAVVCKIASLVVHLDIVASISPLVVLGTVIFSVGIGIVFGVYPARKASRLSPIEALRHE